MEFRWKLANQLVIGDAWSLAVENAIGRLLNSFIVTDHRDSRILRQCGAKKLTMISIRLLFTTLQYPGDSMCSFPGTFGADSETREDTTWHPCHHALVCLQLVLLAVKKDSLLKPEIVLFCYF
ncbi:hypothetical protein Dimus_019289 [Dionaea muscipula]